MKPVVIRIIAATLCVVIIFGLVAIFLSNKEKDKIAPQVKSGNGSKVKPDTIMIEMNEGYSVTAAEYFYHVLGVRDRYVSQYGETVFDMYPELVQSVFDEADMIVINGAAYTMWAKEEGFELSEQDIEEFENQVVELKKYLEENGKTYETHLKENYLTEELFREVYVKNMFINKFLMHCVEADNPLMVVSDEERAEYIKKNVILGAKHILISEESAESEEERQLLAESILQRIEAGEDFDELMKEYTKDPGLESSPNGYTFREGEFVIEFEETTLGLEIGEVSGLVHTSFGIHIIMRIEPDAESVDTWIQKDRVELKRLEYEKILDPKTTKARDGLILMDMKSVV